MQYRVTLIKGDGIGPEVTGAVCEILRAAGAPIEWEEAPAGGEAMEKYGVPMPEVTLQSIRKNRLGLKGPLMTPKGAGFRSANVALRQELERFVRLDREVSLFDFALLTLVSQHLAPRPAIIREVGLPAAAAEVSRLTAALLT
ncbi:MAG TPA: isocitrate/isopropylmalate family dehydrogenase, partial [Myxococcota bacterium]|nr:isocitrate/isopropylmalate family dehydrogenase [Myxococcota bacterium]